jgi:hypothetical protein
MVVKISPLDNNEVAHHMLTVVDNNEHRQVLLESICVPSLIFGCNRVDIFSCQDLKSPLSC